MADQTEGIRRVMSSVINSELTERKELETQYGQVWDSDEVTSDFEIEGFMAPFVVAIRRSDGVKGTLMFQHSPRYYFEWTEA